MTIQEQLDMLTKTVVNIIDRLDSISFYTNADVAGVRQNVADITPTILTKTAYLDDTEVVFTDVPAGNMTVYFDKPYTVERDNNIVRITFEPLEEVATVTISIL